MTERINTGEYEDLHRQTAEYQDWCRRRDIAMQQAYAERQTKLKSNDLEEFLAGYDPAEVGRVDPLNPSCLAGQRHIDKLVEFMRREMHDLEHRGKLHKYVSQSEFVAGLKPCTDVSALRPDSPDRTCPPELSTAMILPSGE